MRFSLSSVFRSVFVLAICLFWVYLRSRSGHQKGIFTITMVPLGLILAATRTYRYQQQSFQVHRDILVRFSSLGCFSWATRKY